MAIDHVEMVRDVLAGITAGVDIPGSRVELQGKKLVLVRQGARS